MSFLSDSLRQRMGRSPEDYNTAFAFDKVNAEMNDPENQEKPMPGLLANIGDFYANYVPFGQKSLNAIGGMASALGGWANTAGVLSNQALNARREELMDEYGVDIASPKLDDNPFMHVGKWLNNAGQSIAERYGLDPKWQNKGLVELMQDPEFRSSERGLSAMVANGLGSSVPYMALGSGVGEVTAGLGEALLGNAAQRAAAYAASKGLPKLGNLLGSKGLPELVGDTLGYSLSTGPLDAYSNATEMIDELRKQGKSDEEIIELIHTAALEELPYDIADNALTGNVISGRLSRLMGGGKNAGRIRRTLGAAGSAVLDIGSEGTQEANQTRITNKYTGEEHSPSFASMLAGILSGKGPAEERGAFAAGALGAGPTAVGGGLRGYLTGGEEESDGGNQPPSASAETQPTNTEGVSNYNMPTQGDDITAQVADLKAGWSDVLPQIGGVLKYQFGNNPVISSGARSYEHQMEVNPDAPNSWHVTRENGGDAVDIVLDDDTTPEQAQAIKKYFEDSGMFEEVDYHDVGSGYHLHLGGLRSGADMQANMPQIATNRGDVDAFMSAIMSQESGGDYNAENVDTGAAGAFQILPQNWPKWAEAAGLGADAPMTPENQNLVARHKMQEYYDQFGNWRDVAIAWYGGPDAVNWSEEAKNRSQDGYASVNEYADGVMARMGNAPSSMSNRFDVSTASDDDFKEFLKWGKDVPIGDSPDTIGRNADLFNAAWTRAGKGDITPKMRQEVAAAMSPEDWTAYDNYRASKMSQTEQAAQSAPMNRTAQQAPQIQMQANHLVPVQVPELKGQAALTGPQSAGQGVQQQVAARNAALQEGQQKAQTIQQQNAYIAEGNQLADAARQLGLVLPEALDTQLRQGNPVIVENARNLVASLQNGGMQNANQVQPTAAESTPAQGNEAGGYTNQNAQPQQSPGARTASSENQVAPTKQEMDLAADEITAADPKNFGKGYRAVRDFYNQQIDEILQPALNTLQGGMQQGVELVPWTDGSGRQSRLSNNAPWYRDFYKKNGRKPTKAELRQMAKQLVSGDSAAPNVEGWAPSTAEEAQAMQETAARIADLERKIAALDAVKDKDAKGKKKKSATKKSNEKKSAEKVREKSAPKSEEKQNPAAQEAAQQEKKAERKETIAEETKAAQNGSEEARAGKDIKMSVKNKKPVSVEENIANGEKAMQKVIEKHSDVKSAMYRDDVGSIDFVWGTPGRGADFKHGYGVSHIIAKRDSENGNGKETAYKLVEVIAKGKVSGNNAMGNTSDPRMFISWDGYTALLVLSRGKKNTWLLSGWENYDSINKNKEESNANGEGYGSTAATSDAPMRSRRAGDDSSSVGSSVAQNQQESKKNETPREKASRIASSSPAMTNVASQFGATVKDGKPVFKTDKQANAFLKAAEAIESESEIQTQSSASEENERIQELLATREWLSEDKLTKQHKAIADFGMEMGVPVVFFKADPDLHGYHVGGVTFLNVNSAMNLEQTFWHETFHWMKNNNKILYKDLIKHISKMEKFSPEQLKAYRDSIGRPGLTKEETIEEMMADAMMNAKDRVSFMKDLAKTDKTLAERLMAWLREMMAKFQAYMNNPEAGLTNTQKEAMSNWLERHARAMVDENGKPIFRVMPNREITLADGSPLPAVAYSFAGKKAKNADLSKLETAEKMQKDGKSAREIWNETGWFQGKDGEWRFEIPDNLNDINLSKVDLLDEVKLSSIYRNPTLYKAYPFLKNVIVSKEKMGKRTYGYANDEDNRIVLNESKLNGKEELESKKTIVHEIQHLIQAKEGFAVGGSEDTVKEELAKLLEKDKRLKRSSKKYLYKHLAGEQEARAVEARAVRYTNRQEQIASAKKDAEEAKEVFEETKRESTPEQLSAMRKRQALQRAIMKAYETEGDITDEMVERREELEEIMGEDLADAYDDMLFAQMEYDSVKRGKGKMPMPRPHFHDALVHFGGEDMPYSARSAKEDDGKQDKSPNENGEKSVDNTGLVQYNNNQGEKPWQNGNIDRATFDKHLAESKMLDIQKAILNAVDGNVDLSKITNIATMVDAREHLKYIADLDKRFKYRLIQSKEDYKDQAAAELEYARRCFENVKQIRERYASQVAYDGRSRRVRNTGYETRSNANKGGTYGGIRDNGWTSIQVGTGKNLAREHFLSMRNKVEQEQRSSSTGAFSTSETVASAKDSSVIYKANLTQDIGKSKEQDLTDLAKYYHGNYSEKDMSAFFRGDNAENNRKHFMLDATRVLSGNDNIMKPIRDELKRREAKTKYSVGKSNKKTVASSVKKSVDRANKLDADNNEQAKKKAMAKADKNLAKEAAKQAKREEKRKEQRAKDIAEGRLVENGRTEIQRPENKGSIGLFDMILNSPSRLAAKFPAFKPYFDLADKAMKKLTMLRETWGKDLADSLTLAKDDKGREMLYSILWEGDKQGKEFSNAELKDEFNANQAVIDAYHSVRSLMDRIYTALDDARRRPKLHAREEMTKEKLAEIKKQPQFYDVLRVDDGKDGHVNVTYREFANWEKTRTLDKEQYEKFKKDDAIQILDAKQNKDGTYTVKTRETIPHIAKRGGYIPHFFHNFMVRVVDKDGNSRTIDSARTEAEAIKKAKDFEKNLGEGEKLIISPKTFDFKSLGVDENMLAVVLGDKDYTRMMQNLQKHGDMTLEEAEKFARRHGKSRFNGQFMQRMGAKGFEESMEWVLKHHVNMSARYVAMQDFKPNALSLFERMYGDFSKDYKGLADYTKDFINDVNGVPPNLEQAITRTLMSIPFYRKHVVSHFGDRAALQLASNITGMVSIAKLGFFNPSSALLNLTQIVNAAAYIGDVNVLWNGIRRGAHGNHENRIIYQNGKEKVTEQQVLDDTGVQYDIGLDSGGGYDKFRPGELAAKSMYFFKTSESIVRRGTVLAAYKAGRERGMDHEQAIEYANEVNRKANFEYGVHDAPNIFRRGSIFAQLFGQFKKYPIKQLEVMADMLPYFSDKTNAKQKAIFWGTYFMLAGLFQWPFGEWFEEIAEMIGLKPGPTLRKWMMQAAGDDPAKQALAKVAMYGAPSLTGVDISQRYGMGGVLPSDMYLGKNPTYLDAALSLMGASTDTAKNIVLALRGALRGDKNETFASLRGISPGVANMVEAAIGEKYDRRGRIATRYDSAYDRILKAIGFRSTKEAVSTELRNIVYDEKEEKKGEKQKAIDKYLDDPTTENARKLRELGVKPDTVKKARQQRKLDNLARTQENMTKKERKEYQDLMKFAK